MSKILVLMVLCMTQLACGDPDGIISPVPSPTGNIGNSGSPTQADDQLGGTGAEADPQDPAWYVDAGPPATEADGDNLDYDHDPAARMADSAEPGEQNEPDCIIAPHGDVTEGGQDAAGCDADETGDRGAQPDSPTPRKRNLP